MAEETQPGIDIDTLVEEKRTQLEIEREKHRKRAEKFGVAYKDPGSRRKFRNDARLERIPSHRGFATGFDLFTEDEFQKRQQRAQRFNMPGQGIEWVPPTTDADETGGLMEVDLFESRREAPAEVERRSEAVHVYGVDLMSTTDVLKYFSDYGPTYVEWLNDSSANVLFKDGPTAKRAIAGLGKPVPPEDLPEGAAAASGVDTISNIEYLWHKGEDFLKSGSNIPLIFRMATVLDVRPQEKVQSRRLWVNAGGVSKKRQRGGLGGGGGRSGGRLMRGRRNQRRGSSSWKQQHQRRGRFSDGDAYDNNNTMAITFGDDDGTGFAGAEINTNQVPSSAPMPDRDTVSYDDL